MKILVCESWDDPRWTERGCAPSRGDGRYYYENSAEGPVETRGQVPAGLIQRARGEDGGDEEDEDEGKGGDSGGGGDGDGASPLVDNTTAARAESSVSLPSFRQLDLSLRPEKDISAWALAYEIREHCTIEQDEYIASRGDKWQHLCRRQDWLPTTSASLAYWLIKTRLWLDHLPSGPDMDLMNVYGQLAEIIAAGGEWVCADGLVIRSYDVSTELGEEWTHLVQQHPRSCELRRSVWE